MPTLDQLLKWAKEQHLYIEIYGDGKVIIEYPTDGRWRYKELSAGNTLLSALRKAKKYIEKGN